MEKSLKKPEEFLYCITTATYIPIMIYYNMHIPFFHDVHFLCQDCRQLLSAIIIVFSLKYFSNTPVGYFFADIAHQKGN